MGLLSHSLSILVTPKKPNLGTLCSFLMVVRKATSLLLTKNSVDTSGFLTGLGCSCAEMLDTENKIDKNVIFLYDILWKRNL
ncbi:hypothetical protein [Capnocytophaga cynodegmi]|uniref:hypothetical protein n=1 Tax=Capnocytophaga cynodegmi TaxID=28189 RepID=UPI001F43CE6A|nr:hypothetical protein [Capnocytophaga cynodegmi]